ncbi:MAG: phenylalanine--tRNA ligase subunit beta [Nanoarchaeota archaeon]|nr:phenylalanine--tRNA ligase subunit beta [Nanoarchaeota archaeon]
MAILTIPKKTFEKDIGKLDEEMQNKIAQFGTPIEDLTKDEVQIEVFPNRPDLLSYHRFKRSFLAFLGKKIGLITYEINKPEKKYDVHIESSVKEVRPYTACAIVKGLRFNDEKIKEIMDLQEKLHLTMGRKRKKAAIGIYPLEKIKLPITFKAIEPDKIKFIPLDSKRELSGLEILQRNPAGKEYAHLLAGKARFPVFLDSENNVLSMPPIINSQVSGRVTEKTKDIFIECSGMEQSVLNKCLNIIVTSLAEMGGKIYQMNLHYGKKETTPNLSTEKIKISLEKVNKVLGLELNERELKRLIEMMGHGYDSKDKSVEVSAWRTDILHEIDIVEDVAIAYGYENFIPEIPDTATIGEINPKEIVKKKISEILSGLGMNEVLNYHLTGKEDQMEKMNVLEKESFIEVEKSKTDYTILRKTLTPLLLRNLAENIDSEYPQEIFEIGKVFSNEVGTISEKESLAVALAPGNFTKIKQSLEYVFKSIDIEISFRESENVPSHFIEGRTADIIMGEKVIGQVGEIHPKTLMSWKIKMPVALFEIGLKKVLEKISNY